MTGASCAAHAILAARGEWITNEKQLLTRAGLREMDDLLGAPDEAIDLCAARSRQGEKRLDHLTTGKNTAGT